MNTIFNFNVALKKIQLEGTLAWEYNPFRNYRLDENMIYYKNRFYNIKDFMIRYFNATKEDEIKVKDNGNILINDEEIDTDKWHTLFPKTEEIPIIYQKGLLVDFITDELDFDLNHPVQITPTYSYDNSVDLIINDGKSLPKIINSRFSAIGKNKYKVVDRNGNNDTNIYDKGTLFEIDTSLYKITSNIPEITFGGLSYGGNLKIGNYHFYFKYSDLDGNESDFIAQSGLVSVFMGNTPNSINTGFRNLNSSKRIRFILSNIDQAYDYIIVYYSRATSEEYLNRTTEYIKISHKFKVSSGASTIIDITGFEDTEPVSFEDVNQRLLIYDSAKTLTVALNMLFLGNTTQSYLDHDLLSRLALYIIPLLNDKQSCNVSSLSNSYSGDISNTYYNPNFIYKYTGYWDDEIYRFGVVFIRNNNTLSPVYNIRGIHLGNKFNIDSLNDYSEKINMNELGDIEELITYDEVTYLIDSSFRISSTNTELENAKGVCYIPLLGSLETVIGIDLYCPNIIIRKLLLLGIKGYFIVRQKRIPTTLCLAYTIGLESESHTPMLPTNDGYVYESFLNEKEDTYISFDDDAKRKSEKGNLLSHSFIDHKRIAPLGSVMPRAAICPDYDVNTPYLNSLFTGQSFTVTTCYSEKLISSDRLFTVSKTDCDINLRYVDVKIIGVEDNVKLVGIGDILFSARAGEAEEAFRYSSVGTKVKKDHGGANLLRGSFGPYLGITGYESAGDLITIKVPGYNPGNMVDYFKIRFEDSSLFYPISDRIVFDSINRSEGIKHLGTHYRGDCYICKFTHRLNRNFTDASTPTNDDIVDPACWTKNINFEDEVLKTEDLDKINLGDVNAVNLGMWVSIILRSNINHSVRSLDESNVDETALMGHSRGFYPYYPTSPKSAYKLQESGTYNKGFEASVGELVFTELPIVPYYRDVFSTRIAYSNIQISSAFKNAYRVFPANHYRDYPITYGEITKIIEWEGDLICILEHGIYRISINERAVAGEGSGGTVYINTSNVLPENPKVISDTFGSLWIDSIVKTPTGIYGVDTVAKKIWKVDNNGVELISDYKVLEFLNKNITLTERELTPIIGIRNVKTHYNSFKHDVMFTFYDDIHGVDEVAWNLCWNEAMNKWVTFYSWIPSFSENIYNSYFSFDRETSKLIAKLALNEKSEHNDYIYLDNTLMDENSSRIIGNLNYNLNFEGSNTETTFRWEIIRDVYGNHNYFKIPEGTNTLEYVNDYGDYVLDIRSITEVQYNGETYLLSGNDWKKGTNTITDISIIEALNRERKCIWKQKFENEEKIDGKITKRKVYLLNIRVTPTTTYSGSNASYAEYVANLNANNLLTGGYIERTIAVIPKEHLEALSTDFWKHGLAGIIDIKEDILPTKWYGKIHPFEFEFIVRDLPDTHKIFDDLVIISNKAEPESFHYEIIGECYEFEKDKKNMYIRQEATKELFQNDGYNISFNNNYKTLLENHRRIKGSDNFEKSTIFPLYYRRDDKLNIIEDYYHLRPGETGKDFSNLSGSEIVYNKNLSEFRIWTHSEGVDIQDENKGRLRGNMHYKEDKWYIQIPSIRFILSNEPDWGICYDGSGSSDKIPIELLLSNFVNATDIYKDNPVLKDRGLVFWTEDKIRRQEAKIKDKYIKIRIRYSGTDLAVISAIKTLYSISYA